MSLLDAGCHCWVSFLDFGCHGKMSLVECCCWVLLDAIDGCQLRVSLLGGIAGCKEQDGFNALSQSGRDASCCMPL